MAVEVRGGKPGPFGAPARVTCDSHIGSGAPRWRAWSAKALGL